MFEIMVIISLHYKEKKMRKRNKFLVWFLAVAIVISMMPVYAFAGVEEGQMHRCKILW